MVITQVPVAELRGLVDMDKKPHSGKTIVGTGDKPV